MQWIKGLRWKIVAQNIKIKRNKGKKKQEKYSLLVTRSREAVAVKSPNFSYQFIY